MVVIDLARGMWTTLRSMFEKPVTYQYPEIKRPVRERFRGRHELKRYDNGLEKCIGCALCAAACPADAIFVESSENSDKQRFSPGERYASTYEINMLRCIYCGFCEEACPTEAIVLGDQYELSFTSRANKTTAKRRGQEYVSQYSLTKLEGMNLYDQARLMEEGIENIENLAHHNLMELIVRTTHPHASSGGHV